MLPIYPKRLTPRIWIIAMTVILFSIFLFAPVNTAYAADATGAETLLSDAGSALDYVWVLVAAFLVFVMQAGFAMLEAGFCRAKNAINLMMKSFLPICPSKENQSMCE